MTSHDVQDFLKALNAMKESYTCGVCSELYRDPVTLSKCFHIICAEHFDSLKRCPNCNISLEGCTTFADDNGKLESAIESAKELDKIFKGYKPKAVAKPPSVSSANTSKKKPAKVNDAAKIVDEPETSKKVLSDKTKRKTEKSNANVSLLSSAICKGETPFQLASAELKNILLIASDDIIQTQSMNVTHMSALYSELAYDDIRVYCVSEFRTVFKKLKILSKSHSNLHIEAKITKKVTHLIVDVEESGICQSSLEVLHGVVNSIWILSSDWVTKSTEDKLEPFHSYEVSGIGTTTYQGPKNSRYNKYKQLPGIFDGCHFYFHNFSSKYEISKKIMVTKAILAKLVTDADGVVLRRAPNPEFIPEDERLIPYHAKKGGKLVNCSHYIIFKDMYEPMYNMQHLKALPIGWLIECIEKYELCEPW